MPRYCIRTGMLPLQPIPLKGLSDFVRGMADTDARNRTLLRWL